MFDVITQKLFGNEQVIRSLPVHERTLFLTFDDGPDAVFTEQVLAVLSEYSVSATFFLIAQKAQQEKSLVKKIHQQGHRVGNHSEDHTYAHFFKGVPHLRDWILRSEDALSQILGEATVGFRSPSGVVCPPLLQALRQIHTPLYLWNRRFYDTLFSWQESQVLKLLPRLQSGDILLLHDRQKLQNQLSFLCTLRLLLKQGREHGWEFAALPKKDKESV